MKRNIKELLLFINFNKIAVNAVRIDSSNHFIDVPNLTIGDVTGGKRYTIPSVFGPDYKYLVIVITNLTDYAASGYNEVYQIQAQIN